VAGPRAESPGPGRARPLRAQRRRASRPPHPEGPGAHHEARRL